MSSVLEHQKALPKRKRRRKISSKNRTRVRVTKQKKNFPLFHWLKTLGIAISIFIFIIISIFAFQYAKNSLQSSNFLALKKIDIHISPPHHVLSTQSILKSLSIHPGMNILQADVNEIANQITENPRIEKVEVLRKLTGKIEIFIQEREPAAYVKSGPHLNLLIDRHGILFPLQEGLETPNLPILTGIHVAGTPQNKDIAPALDLLTMLNKKMASQVSEIQIRDNGDIDIWMQYGLQIRMGKGNFWSKIQRLAILRNQKGRMFRHWKYIDLRWGDPVTAS